MPKDEIVAVIDRCIYCGATPRDAELTDEHIVLFALGGTYVLAKATCTKCQEITKLTEERVLRHVNTIGMARVRLDIRTRRPKQRKQPYRTRIERPESVGETVHIPPDQLPALVVLPRFELPGLLVGREDTEEIPIAEWWGFSFDSDYDEKMKTLGGQFGKGSVGLGHLRLDELARMLAKIAHGAAVWLIGSGNFAPLLPDLIRKERNDLSVFVGGSPERPPPEPKHVKLALNWLDSPHGELLVAAVWLFPLLGAPVFLVVVGRRPAQRSHEQPATVQDAPDDEPV